MEILPLLAAAPLPSLATSVTAPPNAAATQQFAALMQAPAAADMAAVSAAGVPAAGVPAAGVPAAGIPAAGIPAAGPVSVGDRILSGMQNVSSEMRDHWTRVADTLRPGSPELDMQGMLSLQLQLTQASVQYDLMGKLVSRSTQTFDQLVRVQ